MSLDPDLTRQAAAKLSPGSTGMASARTEGPPRPSTRTCRKGPWPALGVTILLSFLLLAGQVRALPPALSTRRSRATSTARRRWPSRRTAGSLSRWRTERQGSSRAASCGRPRSRVWWSTGQGERGLLGVAFHPNFASNRYVYFYSHGACWTGTGPQPHHPLHRRRRCGRRRQRGDDPGSGRPLVRHQPQRRRHGVRQGRQALRGGGR